MNAIEKFELLLNNGIKIITFDEFEKSSKKKLKRTKWTIIKKNKKVLLLVNSKISISDLLMYYNDITEIIENIINIKFFIY